MTEYIERETLYEKAYWHGEHPDVGNPFPDGVEAVDIRDVDAIPSADVAPVRHGRWLFVTAGQMTSAWCCSECGRAVVITCDEELRQSKLEKEYPFCHCGAKMDLEEP